MQKKDWIGVVIATMLIAYGLQACSGCNDKQEKKIKKEQAEVSASQDSIDYWLDNRVVNWKGWMDTAFAEPFDVDSLDAFAMDTINAFTTMMTEDRFKQFSPYFIYSPDKKMAIDMISYGTILEKDSRGKFQLEGGEPDSEVAIVDIASKVRKRILFVGPSIILKEATWIDNYSIIIVGAMSDDEGRYFPMVWKYNLASGELLNWSTNKSLEAKAPKDTLSKTISASGKK